MIAAANKEQGRILREAMHERDKIIVEARKQAEAAAQKELDEVKKQIQQEKEAVSYTHLRQRGEYGQGERHGLGRQRAHDKVAVVAWGKQLRRAEARQYALNGGKKQNERRAREGEQKALRAHRLPEI